MEVYNKDRDKHTSINDEIREQNAKLKNAPLKEKISYFMEYYFKMTLAIIAGAALIIGIIVTMVTAPDDIGFAAYFFNNPDFKVDTEMQEDFIAYLGIDTKEHDAFIDSSLYYNSEIQSQDVLTNLEKSMSIISTNELDVIVGNEEVIEHFSLIECTSDITTVLPADLLEQFKDDLYYSTNPDTGVTTPVGIYITDAPKLKQYGYYTGTEPILTFLINSNSMDNAIAFLRYLYTE